MIKIENLKENVEFNKTVADWIYNEFIKGIRHGITYENILERYEKNNKNIIATLVAIEGDICIGTASLYYNDLKERKDLKPWLASLYVSEKSRNRGIAKKLIDKIGELTKNLGYTKLYLRTEHAAEYYKKSGWKSIYKTIDEFNLETEVFMKEV